MSTQRQRDCFVDGLFAAFGLIDPNSTTGLRYEGYCDHRAGKARDANPYTSWCLGSLAEKYWWEGWDKSEATLSEDQPQ